MISVTQIAQLQTELAAAATALEDLRGSLLRISGQISVLSADDVDPPPPYRPVVHHPSGTPIPWRMGR